MGWKKIQKNIFCTPKNNFFGPNFFCDLILALSMILGGVEKKLFFGGALTKSIWRIVAREDNVVCQIQCI